MISATKVEQKNLLEVFELDVLISRTDREIEGLAINSELGTLREAVREASENLLNANSKLGFLQNEFSKLSSDEKLVASRILQDESKSKSVTSERELKAIESELESLRVRKSNLEDSELDLLEQIQLATELASESNSLRKKASEQLELENSSVESKTQSLKELVKDLSGKRSIVASSLSEELLSAYTQKARRGVAVSQTLGRDCSACRLAINSVEFDAIMARPEDTLPTCPNCDAFIVR